MNEAAQDQQDADQAVGALDGFHLTGTSSERIVIILHTMNDC
jgi:hypothetical protein